MSGLNENYKKCDAEYKRFRKKLVGCEGKKSQARTSPRDFWPEQLKGGIFCQMEKEMDRAGFGGEIRSSFKDIL